MTNQMERVRAEVTTVERGGEIYVFAEDYATILAERDRLREALVKIVDRPLEMVWGTDEEIREAMGDIDRIAEAALKGDQT